MPNKRRQLVDDAELQRRQAQSRRDKARNRREQNESLRAFTRAFQRSLTQGVEPRPTATKPPSSTVLDEDAFSMLEISRINARSDKFIHSTAKLFNNTKYSDAEICIYDVKLPIHKSVICLQSAYFEKAFQEPFVEGSSGVLTFGDGSGAAHWRVLEYLYTGDYSNDVSNFEDDPELMKDPRVYALAEMFFLEDLKALSTTKLQRKLETLWTCDSFPDCVREIYAVTPETDRTMRSAVVAVASDHAAKLCEEDVFKDLIREGGDFAVDFVESIAPKSLGWY